MRPAVELGVFKDLSGLAMNTLALCPKVICIQDRWMVDDFAEQGLPFSFSMFVHHLAQPECLGIVWLLHCSSLVFCAQGMAGARPRLIVAVSTQTWGLKYACMMDGVHLLLSVCTKFTSVGASNTSLDEQTFD